MCQKVEIGLCASAISIKLHQSPTLCQMWEAVSGQSESVPGVI